MWSPWHVQHLLQLFCILDGLSMSIYTFFKMPLQAVCALYFTLTMWAITCQCSGEQPALARFGSVNSWMTKSIEGQPDGQHQITSCSNQPPLRGPVSSFQRGRGSLWYWVDGDWQTQRFGLFPIRNAIKLSAWQQSGVGAGTICGHCPDN